MTNFMYLCHSTFSHLATCIDNICAYVKMLESTAYFDLAENCFDAKSFLEMCLL